MVSLPKFKKALGNRATKTAKNIRRKSRRKPRKNRTLINTRKRVGGGYGSWRYKMATLPKAFEEAALFADNVSSLEKEYQRMSFDERAESERIARASRESRESRGSIKNPDGVNKEYNAYNASLERFLGIWRNMTPYQKKTARELYMQYNNEDGVMHDGPYIRIFGRY